ncbi:MAG: hypothetical protein R3F37_10325 [Candidatus Competibacteraceae bacterium]
MKESVPEKTALAFKPSHQEQSASILNYAEKQALLRALELHQVEYHGDRVASQNEP